MQHSSFVSPVFGQPSVRTLRNAEEAAQASVILDKRKGWPLFSSDNVSQVRAAAS